MLLNTYAYLKNKFIYLILFILEKSLVIVFIVKLAILVLCTFNIYFDINDILLMSWPDEPNDNEDSNLPDSSAIGANGANGTDGTNGTSGTNGTNGSNGTNGTNGSNGNGESSNNQPDTPRPNHEFLEVYTDTRNGQDIYEWDYGRIHERIHDEAGDTYTEQQENTVYGDISGEVLREGTRRNVDPERLKESVMWLYDYKDQVDTSYCDKCNGSESDTQSNGNNGNDDNDNNDGSNGTNGINSTNSNNTNSTNETNANGTNGNAADSGTETNGANNNPTNTGAETGGQENSARETITYTNRKQ